MDPLVSALSPGVLAETAAARVSALDARARLSLRARGDLAPLNAALGVTLPGRIGAVGAGDVEIACLGPDEWLVLAPAAAPLLAACAEVYPGLPHSLVDISGREVSLRLEGPRAVELLTLGCPRDIDAIPVGKVRRTVFDGVSVVLWRDGTDSFRLDVWNSFAPHLLHLLETGCRELAADTH